MNIRVFARRGTAEARTPVIKYANFKVRKLGEVIDLEKNKKISITVNKQEE